MSKSSIKVTYDIHIGPYDMKLTKEEAESLFEQLEEVLGKKKKNIPIPNWPHTEPAPFVPITPSPNYPKTTDPFWPNYPTYPQVWCGMSMFPKENFLITQKKYKFK